MQTQGSFLTATEDYLIYNKFEIPMRMILLDYEGKIISELEVAEEYIYDGIVWFLGGNKGNFYYGGEGGNDGEREYIIRLFSINEKEVNIVIDDQIDWNEMM